ncbi:MAG: transcription elongation factor GreA, partial [Spirochaetes bacterium]|nr:transcription elongation factor GreA [Spirochaetota bacterium]
MSDSILKKLADLLNEEKWTRATLNSYTIGNFKELDTMLEAAAEENIETEMQTLCQEHLKHTKNSIIALYLSGVISLHQHLVDDSHLIMLINIFSDNHKWNIVEYLCDRILDFGENKYALRTLAESYEKNNEDEKKFKVWERLIKVDYEEADIVKQLAEKKELEGDLKSSIEYYKRAIYRYINRKSFNQVKEIWGKLVNYSPEDIDFFFNIEQKISKILNKERAASLLEELFPYYKNNGDYDTAITILKRILAYESKNSTARKEIIECFKEKYKDHSQLEEYIKVSNLTQSWRNVHDAISDFEKHISFDEGNYVFHRNWGIGKIVNIKDDQILIDFEHRKNHKMSLKMAVSALKILGKEHIWVLKSVMDKDELKKKVKENISWTLQTIIKSHNNATTMKV